MKKKAKTEMQAYIDRAKRYPLLSADEEKDLAVKIKSGDRQARQRLINCNLLLACSVAHRYVKYLWHHTGISYEDLIQEANVGLVIAADSFDEQQNTRFSTLATNIIKQLIIKSLNRHGRNIRLPEKVVRDIIKCEQITDELRQKFARKPTREEIAVKMKITEKKVALLQHLGNHSGDEETITDGEITNTVWGVVKDPKVNVEDEAINNVTRENLMKQMDTLLNKKERHIMNERLGYNEDNAPKTLREIRLDVGLSHERIRQIEEQGARKLKIFNRGRRQYCELQRKQFIAEREL